MPQPPPWTLALLALVSLSSTSLYLTLLTFDFDGMNEDMEMFTLNNMTQLLSYLDPLHPLLANISNIQSLGQDQGIKWLDDVTNQVTASSEVESPIRYGLGLQLFSLHLQTSYK
jgi:hypothetical protein